MIRKQRYGNDCIIIIIVIVIVIIIKQVRPQRRLLGGESAVEGDRISPLGKDHGTWTVVTVSAYYYYYCVRHSTWDRLCCQPAFNSTHFV